MKTDWVSAHIYYQGNLNQVLIELVSPFIEQYQHLLDGYSPFFFIRYGEDGNHIRLRLCSTATVLIKNELTRQSDLFFKQRPEEKNRLIFTGYIPEITRYGNIITLPLAESFFAASSALILRWIVNQQGSLYTQAIKLHLMLIQCSGYSWEEIIKLCDTFISDWLRPLSDPAISGEENKKKLLELFDKSFEPLADQICEAALNFWRELNDQTFPPDLKHLYRINQVMIQSYSDEGFTQKNNQSILMSFIHMNNNRIGIGNHEESYIMYCTLRCLCYIEKSI